MQLRARVLRGDRSWYECMYVKETLRIRRGSTFGVTGPVWGVELRVSGLRFQGLSFGAYSSEVGTSCP